jgi:phage terminase large subunit-like protein
VTKERFSDAEADLAVDFFRKYLSFSKGPEGGKPFILRPFQVPIIRDIFGQQVWDDEAGGWVRKIRTAYIEIPRKNGKTELGAGIALKMLCQDHEVGAEVYSVAEDLDQAYKVFNAARTMVQGHPLLSKKMKCYRRLIEHENGGIYRALPSDAAGNHGHNPSAVIFDELHAQKNRELWDVMTSGGGTRNQPLTVAFSTAGTDRESICWDIHDKGEKWADGIITDPSFYYVRFGMKPGDDWEDEAVWRRVNPALGDFLRTSFLRSEYTDAALSPAKQNAFRNLYLNEWTQQSIRWLDMGLWDDSAGSVVEPDLAGKPCFGGLYVGGSGGLAAWVMVFPDGDKVKLLPRFFLPEEALTKSPHSGVYADWKRHDLLTVTPGRDVDYPRIRSQIEKDAGKFEIRGMNLFTVWLGSQLAQELVEQFGSRLVTGFRNTFPGYSIAVREFERLLAAGGLEHGGNPVLRWMADSIVVRHNVDGDVKPDTEGSQSPISGLVATLMALDLTARDAGPAEPMVRWS